MKTYSIYLKGGQIVVVRATRLDIERDIRGVMTNFRWYRPDRKIMHLNPLDVSAIVED